MSGQPAPGSNPNLARSPANLNAEGVLNIARLSTGVQLEHSLYDDDGVLLLASGTTITAEFLRLLRKRQIRYVQAWDKPPPIRVHEVDRATIERVEAELTRPECARLDGRPLDASRRPRVSFEELARRTKKGKVRHDVATADMTSFCKALESEERVSDRELFRIARDFADMVAVDLDLLPTIISLRSTPDDFLYQHCVSVSALSMVIAAQLGFRHERVMEIGLAAMLQDVGMLRVPVSIRLAPRTLSESELEIIHLHPAYTVDYLESIPSLPRDVRYVGYQVHERVDQTGYPGKRGGSTIHIYAKIIAVADVYIAMTSPRPYRAAHTPYEAATTILQDCGLGHFDNRVVRALLDGISLFPTGSYLELDDGRQAKVVRANPNRHTRPVVNILRGDGSASEEMLDLAASVDVRVSKTLTEPVMSPAQ